LGCLDEAAAHLDRAAALAPDLAQPRMARGMLRLRRGDLSGWIDYGWRFAAGEALPDRRFTVPRWQGEPAPDAALLLWREQGLGDELMFATAYRDAMARAGRTVIECDPRLVGLFRRSFPTAEVRAEPPPGLAGREESPDADLETPAGSLGRWLRRSLASFDGAPYLKPDPARVAVWAERLAALGPGLTVGVCWRSRLMTARRRPAYADFTDWLPLLRLPGVRVVNLQYDAGEEELRGLEERHGVTLARWSGLDLTDDLEEVAALVSGLDLVVAAPTAVGELAGALGVPVWRVSGPTDWSMLGAGARPWFASMRVLAPGPGEPLGPVLARAARDLQSLA
ncbi:MAG TPA: hypothetical protein VED40_03640, partial [Azospirillaceae bacterium]|nr:hypothetical protein [Azospirillaceae bacterium]